MQDNLCLLQLFLEMFMRAFRFFVGMIKVKGSERLYE